MPFHDTARTVVADSAFASVKTLVELERCGLFFMGLVKTASSAYPKQHMVDWATNCAHRGEFRVMESDSPFSTKMYALCWYDRKPKCILSNRGTTRPGTESVRVRHQIVRRDDGTSDTLRYTLNVKRPEMIELLFAAFLAVDVHARVHWPWRKGGQQKRGDIVYLAPFSV